MCVVLDAELNGGKLARSVDDEWKGVLPVDTLGGTQSMTVIWEPGLYQLLSKSQKPNAKLFQKWVFGEVVPSIRQKGHYSLTPQLPQTYLEALKTLVVTLEEKEEKEKLLLLAEAQNQKLEEELLVLEEVIEEYKPLVFLAQTLINSDSDWVDVGELAQACKIENYRGRNRFYQLLREIGFIQKGNTRPYQVHIEAGRAKVVRKEREYQPGVFDPKTLISPKGQEWIAKKILEYTEKDKVEAEMEAVTFKLTPEDF